MPRMADFLANPQNFIAQTPLLVDRTNAVTIGRIRLLDKNGGYPNDGVPAAPTLANHINVMTARHNQRHLRVTQHGGMSRAPADTFVDFTISDAHSGYGATVAGLDFLVPAGGTEAFYLPFKPNKI